MILQSTKIKLKCQSTTMQIQCHTFSLDWQKWIYQYTSTSDLSYTNIISIILNSSIFIYMPYKKIICHMDARWKFKSSKLKPVQLELFWNRELDINLWAFRNPLQTCFHSFCIWWDFAKNFKCSYDTAKY